MNANIPFFDAFIHGIADTITPARIHAIRCRAGKALVFHAHLHSGAHYSLIPIHHITATPETKPKPLKELQPYDCFSDHPEIIVYDYFRFRQVIHKTLGPANYLFTIDFLDNHFSDNPQEFKQFHVIQTLDGHISATPNNYLLFQEKTLTGTPDWKSAPILKRQSAYPSAETLDNTL